MGVLGLVGPPRRVPTAPTIMNSIKVMTRKPTTVPTKELTLTTILFIRTFILEKLVPKNRLTVGPTTLPISEPMTEAKVLLTIMLIVTLSIPLCTVKVPNLLKNPPTFPILPLVTRKLIFPSFPRCKGMHPCSRQWTPGATVRENDSSSFSPVKNKMGKFVDPFAP